MNMYQTYVPFTHQQTAFQQPSYPAAYGMHRSTRPTRYNMADQLTFAGTVYGTPAHTYQAHAQPPAQMIAPAMHQSRGTPVANQPVIQAQQPPMVPLQTNNSEINEPTQLPSKQIAPRTRRTAIITDPNTGKDVDIEQLAKEEPKSQVASSRANESFTGASTHSNSLSTVSHLKICKLVSLHN